MAFLNGLLMILLILLGLFLILLVLIQRGKGGGLAGAFGGMGGQSAFGTKAGDLFTWITYGVSTCWLLLCLLCIVLLSHTTKERFRLSADTEVQGAPLTPGDAGGAPAEGGGGSQGPAGDAGEKPNP